ncbi:tyrosine kinase-like protein [Plasmodium sp. gorilla clade G2]|uniref:tyrosine kinase-like protein n=1 Tax=Plasmodium sp. gorilla clade G2 TaxID=880535 RepID=UPI000D209AA7|nr:tyrosine kinase-like protein [Plasmodium sp. gorilla clade G2]SOV15633.1 tyrosine kinase-like protein [Plasmodium sp. gorilla clade G2]
MEDKNLEKNAVEAFKQKMEKKKQEYLRFNLSRNDDNMKDGDEKKKEININNNDNFNIKNHYVNDKHIDNKYINRHIKNIHVSNNDVINNDVINNHVNNNHINNNHINNNHINNNHVNNNHVNNNHVNNNHINNNHINNNPINNNHINNNHINNNRINNNPINNNHINNNHINNNRINNNNNINRMNSSRHKNRKVVYIETYDTYDKYILNMYDEENETYEDGMNRENGESRTPNEGIEFNRIEKREENIFIPLKILSNKYDFNDLVEATNNFSEYNRIAKGGNGTVYKGVLKNCINVAIKVLKKNENNGFENEIIIMSRYRHNNILSLLGYAMNKNNFYLIYEYVNLGDLRTLLFNHYYYYNSKNKENPELSYYNISCYENYLRKKKSASSCSSTNYNTSTFYKQNIFPYFNNSKYSPFQQNSFDNNTPLFLSFSIRINILVQIINVLCYLHTSSPIVYHRDLKSANILIDDQFNAKLGDFGLSFVYMNNNNVFNLTGGTPGYADPYYISTHEINEQTEIYSFGALILEMLVSKSPAIHVGKNYNCIYSKNEKCPIFYHKKKHDNDDNVFDYLVNHLNMSDYKSIYSILDYSVNFPDFLVEKLTKLSFLCLNPNIKNRPSSKLVNLILLEIQKECDLFMKKQQETFKRKFNCINMYLEDMERGEQKQNKKYIYNNNNNNIDSHNNSYNSNILEKNEKNFSESKGNNKNKKFKTEDSNKLEQNYNIFLKKIKEINYNTLKKSFYNFVYPMFKNENIYNFSEHMHKRKKECPVEHIKEHIKNAKKNSSTIENNELNMNDISTPDYSKFKYNTISNLCNIKECILHKMHKDFFSKNYILNSFSFNLMNCYFLKFISNYLKYVNMPNGSNSLLIKDDDDDDDEYEDEEEEEGEGEEGEYEQAHLSKKKYIEDKYKEEKYKDNIHNEENKANEEEGKRRSSFKTHIERLFKIYQEDIHNSMNNKLKKKKTMKEQIHQKKKNNNINNINHIDNINNVDNNKENMNNRKNKQINLQENNVYNNNNNANNNHNIYNKNINNHNNISNNPFKGIEKDYIDKNNMINVISKCPIKHPNINNINNINNIYANYENNKNDVRYHVPFNNNDYLLNNQNFLEPNPDYMNNNHNNNNNNNNNYYYNNNQIYMNNFYMNNKYNNMNMEHMKNYYNNAYNNEYYNHINLSNIPYNNIQLENGHFHNINMNNQNMIPFQNINNSLYASNQVKINNEHIINGVHNNICNNMQNVSKNICNPSSDINHEKNEVQNILSNSNEQYLKRNYRDNTPKISFQFNKEKNNEQDIKEDCLNNKENISNNLENLRMLHKDIQNEKDANNIKETDEDTYCNSASLLRDYNAYKKNINNNDLLLSDDNFMTSPYDNINDTHILYISNFVNFINLENNKNINDSNTCAWFNKNVFEVLIDEHKFFSSVTFLDILYEFNVFNVKRDGHVFIENDNEYVLQGKWCDYDSNKNNSTSVNFEENFCFEIAISEDNENNTHSVFLLKSNQLKHTDNIQNDNTMTKKIWVSEYLGRRNEFLEKILKRNISNILYECISRKHCLFLLEVHMKKINKPTSYDNKVKGNFSYFYFEYNIKVLCNSENCIFTNNHILHKNNTYSYTLPNNILSLLVFSEDKLIKGKYHTENQINTTQKVHFPLYPFFVNINFYNEK